MPGVTNTVPRLVRDSRKGISPESQRQEPEEERLVEPTSTQRRASGGAYNVLRSVVRCCSSVRTAILEIGDADDEPALTDFTPRMAGQRAAWQRALSPHHLAGDSSADAHDRPVRLSGARGRVRVIACMRVLPKRPKQPEDVWRERQGGRARHVRQLLPQQHALPTQV